MSSLQDWLVCTTCHQALSVRLNEILAKLRLTTPIVDCPGDSAALISNIPCSLLRRHRLDRVLHILELEDTCLSSAFFVYLTG